MTITEPSVFSRPFAVSGPFPFVCTVVGPSHDRSRVPRPFKILLTKHTLADSKHTEFFSPNTDSITNHYTTFTTSPFSPHRHPTTIPTMSPPHHLHHVATAPLYHHFHQIAAFITSLFPLFASIVNEELIQIKKQYCDAVVL